MILSAIIGLLGSFLPHAMDIFKQRQDNKQELAILQLQLANGAANKLAEINAQAELAEIAATRTVVNTSIKWVDALNESVRPVLMFAYFLLYVFVKICVFYLLKNIASPFDALNLIWTTADMEIFCVMIAYYYGTRTITKMRQGK